MEWSHTNWSSSMAHIIWPVWWTDYWFKYKLYYKVGCVFLIVLCPEFHTGQYRVDNHREDAPHFMSIICAAKSRLSTESPSTKIVFGRNENLTEKSDRKMFIWYNLPFVQLSSGRHHLLSGRFRLRLLNNLRKMATSVQEEDWKDIFVRIWWK